MFFATNDVVKNVAKEHSDVVKELTNVVKKSLFRHGRAICEL